MFRKPNHGEVQMGGAGIGGGEGRFVIQLGVNRTLQQNTYKWESVGRNHQVL